MQVRRSFHVGSKTLGCLHTVATHLREYYFIYGICLVEPGSSSFTELVRGTVFKQIHSESKTIDNKV